MNIVPRPDAHWAHLVAVVDSAEDAMLALAPDGRVVEANRAACRLFGFAEEALSGWH